MSNVEQLALEPSARKAHTDTTPHSALGPGRAGATCCRTRRNYAIMRIAALSPQPMPFGIVSCATPPSRFPEFQMKEIRMLVRNLIEGRDRQFLRYLLVGGWNTAFGVGLYALAYHMLHDRVHYLVLLIPCNIMAITNAYVCYKLVVFRTRGGWLREYLRFYIVYGGAMLLGIGLVALQVQLLHLHPVWANILTTVVTVVCSFFGHKRISFAR
ncbi:MAG: GtrA family protein [Magnetococcus sp. WYHC-3]